MLNRKYPALALACLAVCAVRGAHAQTSCPAPQGVAFEQQSWTEIQRDIGCGFTTIIIPVGGTEQSGPYIAVGKHNARVQALADEIARRAGHTLVAPVVAYVPEGSVSPRTSHMRFPGTISIPADVFEKLVASAADSFRVQGFRFVVLLGDHGGYQAALRKVADTLNPAWRRSGARVLYVPEYYDVVPHQYADWLRQKGYGADVGKHADLSDTSLMLAVDPDMVREQALRQAPPPTPAQGIYGGDPRRATAALGRVGLDMQVSAALAAIERARAP
ncbi:MAG: creatininase family protein [Acetobacter sp.]